MLRKLTLFTCLIVLLSGSILPGLSAQDNIRTASKTITKNLSFSPGDTVYIDGKKAEIIINTWEKNEVRVQLKITAKHTSDLIAERDLENSVYLIEKIGNAIYIRNDLSVDETTPESNVKARYQVVMPTFCPLVLKNNFGKTDIGELSNSLEINSEFSQVRLNNVKGAVQITSYFGDIEAEYLSGEVSIDSKRSNIDISELSGDFDIKVKYGIVRIDANQSLINLNVEGQQSDVYFNPNNSSGQELYYNLLAEYGKIKVLNNYKFDFLENSDQAQQAIYGSYKDGYSVNITTTFGKIIIGQ